MATSANGLLACWTWSLYLGRLLAASMLRHVSLTSLSSYVCVFSNTGSSVHFVWLTCSGVENSYVKIADFTSAASHILSSRCCEASNDTEQSTSLLCVVRLMCAIWQSLSCCAISRSLDTVSHVILLAATLLSQGCFLFGFLGPCICCVTRPAVRIANYSWKVFINVKTLTVFATYIWLW